MSNPDRFFEYVRKELSEQTRLMVEACAERDKLRSVLENLVNCASSGAEFRLLRRHCDRSTEALDSARSALWEV